MAESLKLPKGYKESIRNTAGLKPGAARMAARLKALGETIGIHDIGFSDAYRTKARQAELYAKGRTTGKKGDTVTDALPGQSKHEVGEAVDVYFTSGRSEDETFNKKKYEKLAEAYKDVYGGELNWGGDWKKRPDMPHFQIRPGKLVDEPSAKGLKKHGISRGRLDQKLSHHRTQLRKGANKFIKKMGGTPIKGEDSQTLAEDTGPSLKEDKEQRQRDRQAKRPDGDPFEDYLMTVTDALDGTNLKGDDEVTLDGLNTVLARLRGDAKFNPFEEVYLRGNMFARMAQDVISRRRGSGAGN